MKATPYASLALLTVFATTNLQAALPADVPDGKRLHDTSCMTCHDTGVYTRKDRQVHSFDELKQQLEGCSHMANRKFSAAESESVLKYLNDRFYRFR